jgi:threonine/homoserine/homoserine lactone efflux protein
VAFILFAVVAAVTPGPSNIMLIAAGAQAGVVSGLPCLLGVVTGMAVMMFVVPLGLGRLMLAHPLILETLHWGGAAVLLWLSWKIATATSRIDAQPDRDPVGYLGAAIFQWVNAKSWLVTASAAGTFPGTEGTSATVHAASLAGLFVIVALPSGFLWLSFGAAIQRVLRTRRRLRLFNITMGVLLALSIVLMLR